MFALGIAAKTFSSGGPGAAIVQLLLIASFGSLTTYITSALGQNQISSMIKLLTMFSCIGIVIAQVVIAIAALASAFGVQL